MRSIAELVPNVDFLLAMVPEELGYELLVLARENEQNGHFHPASFTQGASHPLQYRDKIELAVGEALAWLEVNLLVIPVPGINGSNGHRVLTRRGRAIADREKFASFRAATAFPKSLLHPAIADHVWLDLARGDLSTAVFRAFKAVEEAVRLAGGFPPTEVGVVLMRKAFNTGTGPLSDPNDPEAEREALANLFVGAIGSYKNPHSHRTVTISDETEAQEMVMLASHLLRIVDARKP